MEEKKTDRSIRYQGAILQDGHILLIRHQEFSSGRSYWVIPGGGREEGETEEECVAREMKEETTLDVRVERLVLDEAALGGVYQRRKTYLCTPLEGTAAPGYEPEEEASSFYQIAEVRWVPLNNAEGWGEEICNDQITGIQMKKLQTIFYGEG